MIVLDAYAVVALLGNEPAAAEVEALLRRERCALPALNLAEAVDIVVRVQGASIEHVRGGVDALVGGGRLELLPASPASAWMAAELRARFYDRRTRALSLADCFLLASAGSGDEVATADPPLAEVARELDLGVIGLPDSTGRRP